MKRMKEMDSILNRAIDGSLISSFTRRAQQLLTEYNKLCGTVRIFGMDKCANIPRRVGIILSFLDVVREYSDIEYTCTYNMERICPKCFSTMKRLGPLLICNECEYTHKIERTLGIILDGNKIKTESTYDACKNFRKEYMHLCGIINELKDGEKEDISSYLYRAGFKNPTRENIRDGIHACGYNNYHDTNYLYHIIMDQPLPNIYHMMDICAQRFEQYFNVFQSLDDREGKNVTNLHFLIKLFLWQENIEYDDCWFRTLSPSTEDKHIRNAKKICTILNDQDKDRNWKYPSIWDRK